MSLIPSTLLANESKSGMYVTGKMGASIQQMSGQFFPVKYILEINGEEEEFNKKIKGDNHRTAVFGAGLGLGYDFYEKFDIPIRTELEFISRSSADDSYSEDDIIFVFPGKTFVKNQIAVNTLIFNAYYDFKNSSDFTPYLSAGLGYAYISQKTFVDVMANGGDRQSLWTRSHATNNFAWSAGAGIKYTVNKDFSFDLSYKYLDAGQAEVYNNLSDTEYNSKTKVKTHDIMLSATYHF
ncbi:outer membrane beta-barrel protein [Arsenophonus sp.]|uniref:outer membrane protein n=1 Tax=Arsenophonus sp. TaxID=1872640 RepID=UPI002854DA4A|nr:outer membrane beta-barrel protein [Arsenophonus sp.]MDR5609749.1 outer membrane beta-barrel protein [Arsenophonus sp.]MDR5613471.1 outer membrane beta-barrel protein [Arsenophonus sp.]